MVGVLRAPNAAGRAPQLPRRLRGRLRRHPVRIRGFELEQLAKQAVVLGVRDLGGIEHVVEPVVAFELPSELQ